MKNIVNEELNYMKYLFDYQRGKVISEQTTNKVLEKDGCEKGFYRDCTTKTCVKTPKASVIVYSQEEFEKDITERVFIMRRLIMNGLKKVGGLPLIFRHHAEHKIF